MSARSFRNARSLLFTEIHSFITREAERIRRAAIDPWAFLTAGPPFRCNDFYGKQISYQGVAFEGSPSAVFWGGFIDPFLRDLVVRAFDFTAKLVADRGLPPRDPLLDTADILRDTASAMYHRMRDIDQRLRGGGYPDRAAPRSIDAYVNHMNTYIDEILTGRLAPKPFLSRLSDFYRAHPIVFWVVSTIIAALSLLAGFF